jgi:hypothetical protein
VLPRVIVCTRVRRREPVEVVVLERPVVAGVEIVGDLRDVANGVFHVAVVCKCRRLAVRQCVLRREIAIVVREVLYRAVAVRDRGERAKRQIARGAHVV